MPLITWNESLSVKIADIDQQHQKLIAMINDLDEAHRLNRDMDALNKIISGLICYTGSHFSAEEHYLERFGYPDLAAHKNAHAQFIKKISDFRADYIHKKAGLSTEIISFLSDWLQTHIKGTDMRYVSFLHQKGMK